MLANDLRDICLELEKVAKDGARWIRDNDTLVSSPESLTKALRQHARSLHTCAQAAGRRMGVAVFGPSQAGKSTLISSLCKGPGGVLNALFSDVPPLNFLREVNPEGGNETTGLVTRFSLDPYPLSPDPIEYPVCLRLFSEMDVVKILANTYFAEAEGASLLLEEAITQRLDALEAKTQAASRLTRDDMEDLAEYVHGLAKNSEYGGILEKVFWGRAIPLGLKLAAHDRAELFACLWGGLEPFTLVYKKLYQALEQLGFAETVFCELAALYDKNAPDFGRGKSIIIVDQLNGLLGEFDSAPVSVTNEAGTKASLPRPELSALTAELHVKVQEKPGPFMEKADILDFPGYRARGKFKDISTDIKKPENLKTCFLRGKVAYLFERYSERKEITAMLLCIGNSVQNNPDLPHVIRPWLENTHGATEIERVGKPITMFLVLTMFDGTVEQGAGATDYVTRWEKRLKASFLDFFGQHDWPQKWAMENGQTRPFNNIFWLQDLAYAHSFLEVKEQEGPDGSGKARISHGVKSEKKQWAMDVLKGYLECDLVQKYIANPEAAWNAVMNDNDGGVSYLLKCLSPVLTDELKTSQLLELTRGAVTNLNQLLRPFFFGADKEEERAKKEQQGFDILEAIQAMRLKSQRFGRLLRDLQLTDSDCQAVYNKPLPPEEFSDIPKDDAPSQPSKSRSIGDIFKNVSAPGTAASSGGSPNIHSPAHSFRRRLELEWQGRLNDMAKKASLQRCYSLNGELFQLLIVELILGAKRLKVFDCIEAQLNKAIRYSNSNPAQSIWKQARLAATALSSYINWLGLSPSSHNVADRTVTLQGNEATLFEAPEELGPFPELPDERTVYDQQYFQDWCWAFMRLMVQNVDFTGAKYNRKENERLGGLLTRLKAAEENLK